MSVCRCIKLTSGLGGSEDEIGLSLSRDLIHVDVVLASWQQLVDVDRGGRMGQIYGDHTHTS